MINGDRLVPEESCLGNPLALVKDNSETPYRLIDRVCALIEYTFMGEKETSDLYKRLDGMTPVQRLASEKY